MYYQVIPTDHLEHHGIIGQKWGVRRFQTKSGQLTAEGKKRYSAKDAKDSALKSTKHWIDSSNKDVQVKKKSSKRGL